MSYLEFEQEQFLHNVTEIKKDLPNLIDKYNCGSLEDAIFNSEPQYLNKTGFSLGREYDQKAREVSASSSIFSVLY